MGILIVTYFEAPWRFPRGTERLSPAKIREEILNLDLITLDIKLNELNAFTVIVSPAGKVKDWLSPTP